MPFLPLLFCKHPSISNSPKKYSESSSFFLKGLCLHSLFTLPISLIITLFLNKTRLTDVLYVWSLAAMSFWHIPFLYKDIISLSVSLENLFALLYPCFVGVIPKLFKYEDMVLQLHPCFSANFFIETFSLYKDIISSFSFSDNLSFITTDYFFAKIIPIINSRNCLKNVLNIY